MLLLPRALEIIVSGVWYQSQENSRTLRERVGSGHASWLGLVPRLLIISECLVAEPLGRCLQVARVSGFLDPFKTSIVIIVWQFWKKLEIMEMAKGVELSGSSYLGEARN